MTCYHSRNMMGFWSGGGILLIMAIAVIVFFVYLSWPRQ